MKEMINVDVGAEILMKVNAKILEIRGAAFLMWRLVPSTVFTPVDELTDDNGVDI